VKATQITGLAAGQDPTQHKYLPFNAGPRTCIGAAFATQVLRISLAMILQRFQFTVCPGQASIASSPFQ